MNFDDAALKWSFFAAGGPGGQHVNKVATAAQLHVEVAKLGLPESVVARLAKHVTKEGFIVITAKEFRSQEMNKNAAMGRLVEMILEARTVPKVRRKTKPTKASGERRLGAKKVRSVIKSGRGKVRD